MAQKNTFLQSPFQDVIDQQAVLPGQQAVPDASRFVPIDTGDEDAATPARSSAPTRADVIRAATAKGVDPALALSIWSQESSSGRNPATSPKGARGGFQVMPGTYTAMMGSSAGQSDPWNNMEAGLRYIAYGQKTLGTTDPALLAAGYHAGYDRKDLKRGIIPATSDGSITTADYARQVAARAGGAVAPMAIKASFTPGQNAVPPAQPAADTSRFVPMSDDEVKALSAPDLSRFVPLSEPEVQELRKINNVPQEKAKAPEFADQAAYLGKSLKAGGYDLLSAGAKILDAINPFTLSEQDAAVLFKNDPAKLKQMQDESAAMILSRFAHRMNANSDEAMKEAPKAAQDYYNSREYATTDTSKAAYTSPVRVISDVVRNLPTMAAMAVTTYFTRGAAVQAEKAALQEGMTAEAARQAAIQAGVKAAAKVGAVTEGGVGYAQQAESAHADASKLTDEQMAKSPMYQDYLRRGFTPEAARAKVIADTAEMSGRIAGIVDAAVNHYGGKFLGKILTEGGSFIPRVMKGAANEAATETIQSGGEQVGQNLAEQTNINPDKKLTEGVGEAMAQGAVVGAVSGGAMAGAGGKGHDGVQPAAAPQAQPQARVEPTLEQPAAQAGATVAAEPQAAAAPSGPLTGAMDATARQETSQRVTVTAPNGQQGSGTLTGFHEDENGEFLAQVQGDDGQMHTLSSADGVAIAPEAQPEAGPLSAALAPVVEEETASPTPPEALQPRPAKPAEPDYNAMSLDELRARLKYIADQAKSAGGWNTMFVKHRKEVEQAIRAKVAEAQEASKPAEEPLSNGPFDDRASANKMMLRHAEATGQPHEVVESGGKFTVQPIQEANNADPNAADLPVRDGRPASSEGSTPAAADQPAGRAGSDERVHGREPAAVQPAPGAGGGAAVATATADASAALTAKQIKAFKRVEKGTANFGTAEKAQGFIDEHGIGATHEVKQTGKKRFDVVAKQRAEPGMQAFAPETGTLGIPRDQMPQVPTESHGGLVRHLNAQGIEHETTTVDPDTLKPTQAEFSPEKVEQAKESDGDRAVIVSNDGHIIDGHHQVLAAQEEGKEVKAIVLDAPIHDALEAVKNSPSTETPTETSAAPANHLEAARQKHARQDEEVRKAAENIARRKAEKEARAQQEGVAEQPVHEEQGKTEPATASAIDRSVKKASAKEKVKPSEMRTWLVGKIDEALAKAGEPDPTIAIGKPYTSNRKTEFTGTKGAVGGNDRIIVYFRQGYGDGTWEVYASNSSKQERIYSFKADGTAAARKAAAAIMERAEKDGLKTKIVEAPTVTFDVPGDGKFTVVNTRAELEAFKKRVLAAPGFKDQRSKGKSEAAAEPVAEPPRAEPDVERAPEPAVAAAEKPEPAAPDVPEQEQTKPAAPIADFGEKIHGARKNIWTGFRESMHEALPSDVRDITLAKHFPEPPYEKLIENGIDPKVMAAFKAIRDSIPAKPRMPHKARSWGDKVALLHDFAGKLINGPMSTDELVRNLRQYSGKQTRSIAERVELYAGLGYPLFTKAKDYTLEENHYTMFAGESPPGGIIKWELERQGQRSVYFDSQQEGIDVLRKKLENEQKPEGEGKQVALDLYRVTATGDIVIGKKVGAGKFIDLKTGFKTVKDARAYLAEHKDELLALLDKKKDVRPERRGVNEPRVGVDRRKGEDVTPEKFGQTFGFRGVQFGNYVEQKRRAADLNNAYDALLDLADTIHVPPAAISLNGTLGLAFGARGKGGKNPAAAHYEPSHVVINLTKTHGAGSLAHEWWHGLDNYFAKLRGDPASFVSAYPQPKMKPDENRKMVADESVRPEALAAFKGVVDAIRQSGMVKRSQALDARRSKDYWSTIHELTARAFESYVIDKATEQGHSNDYLANIVSEDAHEAMNGMIGDDQPFPYPTKAEKPAINAAFDKLFNTLETREDGGKVALYSVADDAAALRQLMDDKAGETTVHRDGIGDIAVHYGDDDWGLAHIARRRGQAFMDRLPGLLANGEIYTKESQPDRVFIGDARDEAVIRLDHGGEPGPWLLTAYEKHPEGRQSSTEEQAPFRKLSDKELKDALTVGPVGSVIARLIEHGTIKVHRSAKTLPKEVKVRNGVQAVTMPDGTMHLVAGALQPANARAVLLHEMFHGGVRPMLGSGQWGELMGRMGSLYRQAESSSGRAREFYDRARARVATAKAKGTVPTRMEVEEFAAYAIEEYEREPSSLPAAVRKWVEDIIGLVKAHIARRYGKQLGAITPAQLSAFAKMAVLDMAAERRGELFGPVGELFSASGDKTIEVDGKTRPIENSEGQLLGDDLHKQLAFWRWFGNSKVTGVGGRPLVVYHGADARRTRFEPKVGKRYTMGREYEVPVTASFFTPDKAFTKAFGKVATKAYLKIEKPLDLRDGAWGVDSDKALSILKDHFGEQVGFLSPDELWEVLDHPGRVAEIRALGYDGAIFMERDAQDESHETYAVFDSTQIKSPSNKGTFDPANPDIRYSIAEGEPTSAETGTVAPTQQQEPPSLTPDEQGLLRRTQASVQDNMNRVKQVQDRIMALTERTTLGKSDYYGAETNRPGRIAARLEDARDKLTEPLMEGIAKAGKTPEQLSELLHAMHAHERNQAIAKINPDMPDGGSGMTDAEANRIIEKYKDDGALHELANQARAIARATLDLKLAYGLIKQEDHDTLSKVYEHYVPLKGDGEYGPKVKRAMGHEGRDEHILENIARDYDQAVVVGEKNLARQSLLRMVLQFKDDSLWTARVPPKGRYVAGKVYDVLKNGEKVATFDSRAAATGFLEAQGPNAAAFTVQDSAGERVAEFTKPLQDNEVMVYVKGDPVRIQIHDETLARQLRPLDQAQMHPILEFMRGTNRFLSKIYTGYNPAFILRNATRDAMTGTINMLGNNGAAVAAKAWARYPQAALALGKWAATKQAPQGKIGSYLTEYRMHGGKVGASYMSDLEEQGANLQAMFDNARGVGATLKDGGTKRAGKVAWHKSVGRLAHVVEVANQATENALRLGLFIALREEGASAAKAAQAAKQVTVDFDRKGSSTGALGAVYLFFNPAIQGTANAMKTLAKGEHREQAWAALGGLALLGVYAASAGMGDDRDRWLGEEWDSRTKNLLLNFGGKQLRLPMSQEYAPVYALGVAMAEGWHGESQIKSAARVVSSFIDAYFPLQGAYRVDSDNHVADIAQAVTPTVFKPLTNTALNRNAFGSQIVPETEMTKDRPDNLKMFRGTKNSAYDKAAQGIASVGEMMGAGKYENDITKISPETLKEFWRTYTGGLGQFVTDSIGLTSMLATDPGQVEGGDWPIWKDFVRTPDAKPLRSRYYQLEREADQVIAEYREAKKAKDGAEGDVIYADQTKKLLLSLAKLIDKNRADLKYFADLKVDINADKDLSGPEKRAKLKETEEKEEQIYRQFFDEFKK